MPSAEPTAVARSPAQLPEGIIAALAALVSVYARCGAPTFLCGAISPMAACSSSRAKKFLRTIYIIKQPGLEWVDHEVRGQILLWLAYPSGGAIGLIALKGMSGGAWGYRSLRWVERKLIRSGP